ncbi:hypothetical protein CERZMDRAFT_92512 [Cercospora zeae-maydis SCOH1-5]|uniref:Uncharacterized protein n=1 Tax=Cercospora zeae-maydis SCOH1-5 TaxID=717836 RepID=A0A6A6FWU1_9PEZI|nr:hypothetical protein CERZMDRAFT_92512 [Cercospora zeae-maydis SCOH1-5]
MESPGQGDNVACGGPTLLAALRLPGIPNADIDHLSMTHSAVYEVRSLLLILIGISMQSGTGSRAPSVAWFKNNRPCMPDSSYDTTRKAEQATCFGRAATRSHYGSYTEADYCQNFFAGATEFVIFQWSSSTSPDGAYGVELWLLAETHAAKESEWPGPGRWSQTKN